MLRLQVREDFYLIYEQDIIQLVDFIYAHI